LVPLGKHIHSQLYVLSIGNNCMYLESKHLNTSCPSHSKQPTTSTIRQPGICTSTCYMPKAWQVTAAHCCCIMTCFALLQTCLTDNNAFLYCCLVHKQATSCNATEQQSGFQIRLQQKHIQSTGLMHRQHMCKVCCQEPSSAYIKQS